MPKHRHQDGSVQLAGRRAPVWRGCWYEYFFNREGQERRARRSMTLGLKGELTKKQAQIRLRDFLAKHLDLRGHARQDAAQSAVESGLVTMTLGEFWSERYLPVAEDRWAESTRRTNRSAVEAHLVPRFGSLPLSAITRFDVQVFLKDLAANFSESTYRRVRVLLSAMMTEAVEQDLLAKNPVAKGVRQPNLRKPVRSYLSSEEIAAITTQVSGRDRLLIRMFATLALRPGEMFALRWDDVLPEGYLRVDEAVWNGQWKAPKTGASTACVYMPHSIRQELDWWRETSAPVTERTLIFPSRRGTPLLPKNVLRRVIRKAAARAVVALTEEQRARGVLRDYVTRVNHRSFRRSCATLLQQYAGVKDIQAHLRHASPNITAGVYVQEIPESVRGAVKKLDHQLFSDLNKIEQKNRGAYEQ